MMGALRDGFEVVATKVTDATGKLDGVDSIGMKVPEWVSPDRPYLMIVTDANYTPLGTADMFHPTDRNGVLERVGKFVREAAGCPVLTGDAGEIYFLTGDTSKLTPGDRVRIVGRALESSSCGKATGIEVQRAERLPSP
jgi:hypothetical protein